MPGRVHYETAERIATITLDNPAALNAFDHEMCLALRRIWSDVEANPDVACAILTALIFGAIASIFTPWGLPALTLPFVFGTLIFVLLKGTTDKLEPIAVEDITTPEEHLKRRGAAAPGVGRDAVGATPATP